VKLNLFSPLPPARSEIARQTANLLPLLAKEAEVVVWSSETRPAEGEARVTVRPYDSRHPPWREISQADATFYQMGNDPRYHHAIWRISQQHPGIVILHDLKLQHFFSGLVFHELGLNRRQYLDLVERHHGGTGRVLAESHLHGLIGTEELAEQCPLTGAATENALAVIVHSKAAQLSISEETPVVHLPLGVGTSLPPGAGWPGSTSSRAEGIYRISVFGFLGPNRRLPALLRALASFAQRDRFRLHIYGTIEGEERIHQLVARLNLNDLVSLHGFVQEDRLEEALRLTDLVVNMRYPSMGEASASQLHCWQYALPALVTRTAWYETLPENTVAFVRPGHEVEDLQAHFSAFLTDPDKYQDLGRNGQRHLAENHSIETYAASLLEMAALVPDFQTRWIARDLAHRAGAALNGWCDSSTMDAFLPRVAQEIGTLASGNPATAATGRTAATSTYLAKSS
jgi:glycosyltransferase involved in cell wall biosynthesis